MALDKKEGYIMSDVIINNLKKSIKGTTVLKNINLKMQSGTIYGLRGKNGCGKTMLMRCVCGLIIPTDGSIEIDGEVLHKDIKFPRSIGALIENPSFLPQYTGYKNLKMLASLTGNISDEDIKIALERVGLDPDDKRIYRKYSLGMKQKLGIANAIMGEPDIIVLDEPINALDEESVSNIKQVLIDLSREDKLIIVACHDREELEYLCDVIFEMKDGSIVKNGEDKD